MVQKRAGVYINSALPGSAPPCSRCVVLSSSTTRFKSVVKPPLASGSPLVQLQTQARSSEDTRALPHEEAVRGDAAPPTCRRQHALLAQVVWGGRGVA
eukprot:scaffold16585_cov36-Phaeocystis_antarctica.AAC.1